MKKISNNILLCAALFISSCGGGGKATSSASSSSGSAEKPKAYVNYAEMVNTRIGNEGKIASEIVLPFEAGYTTPGPAAPFGMVQFTPTFFHPDRGFVVNQLNAGCQNMGNFPVVPLSGELAKSPNNMEKMINSYEVLKAVGGQYKAKLNNSVVANLTATTRTGMAQFTFGSGEQKGTVMIGSGNNSTHIEEAYINITSPSSCEGFADGGQFCGAPTPYKVYFVAEFNKEASEIGTWKDDNINKGSKSSQNENSGAFFTFDVSDGKPVQYKFAISYVSVENARENLKAENPGFDFDKIVEGTQAKWNDYLSRIEVSGGTDDQTTQFYSHLYNVFKGPVTFSDVNGQYIGSDHQVHQEADKSFVYYTGFSNWDTYRTQTQLMALLAPKEASDVVTSHLLFAERSGGGLPRWVLSDYATGIMQGDPSSCVITTAYAFGAKNFDTKKALETMRRGAEEIGLKTQAITVRPGLDEYLEKGYVTSHMGASIAIEYMSADFAIAQFAKNALGDNETYKKYMERTHWWKRLYNPKTGWLNSKNAEGSWKGQNDDWREASYKSYAFMIPYNLGGVIETYGGNAKAEEKLDDLFSKLNAAYHDDWFASGNQPNWNAPWVYNWTGSPYKSQAVVRRIVREQFKNEPSGLPGNEDLGSMGSWYVYMQTGLFPMFPGIGGFTVSTPMFENIKIHMGNGKTISIKGGSPTKDYIKSLSIDGKGYDNTWIPLDKLINGAELTYEVSDQPNKEWGTAVVPPSYE